MSKKKSKALVSSEGTQTPEISFRFPASKVEEAERLLLLFGEEKSELTLRNYEKDLENFAEWMGALNVPQAVAAFLKLRRRDAHAMVILYKGYLRKAPVYTSTRSRDEARVARATGKTPPKPARIGYSANTINRRLTALKSVVSLARVMEIVDWRLEVKGVRVEALRDTRGCGEAGYQKLIDTLEVELAEEDDRDRIAIKRRDLALVRLMHDRGLRRKEPLTADYPADLRLDQTPKRIRILGKKRSAKEWLDLAPATVKALRAWLRSRGKQSGPLFTSFHPTHVGKRLTPQAVNGMIARLAKRAGGVDVTPHGLRHTAATTALDRGASVRDVQKWGRWRSLEMVQIYDDQLNDPGKDIAELVSGPSEDAPDDPEG